MIPSTWWNGVSTQWSEALTGQAHPFVVRRISGGVELEHRLRPHHEPIRLSKRAWHELAAEVALSFARERDGSSPIYGADEPLGPPLCAECGEPFTVAEWDERHSGDDGEDLHEECCPVCADVDEPRFLPALSALMDRPSILE